MKKNIISLLLATLALLFGGCVSTKLESTITPGSAISKLKSFYVVHLAKDERNIDKIIVNQLKTMGFEATSGEAATPPAPVDAIITYQDKWMWDITMYMIELNTQVRNPENNLTMATGHSFRTSLARRSPEEMVKEVLEKIFKK